MMIEPTSAGLDAFVRTSTWDASDLPRACSIDVQLLSWDHPPVLAVSLLVRLARDQMRTYQTWINVASARGKSALRCLAEKNDLRVHIVADQLERTIRVPNFVRRSASRLLKRATPEHACWSSSQFDDVRQQVDTLYPTPRRLWNVGREVERSARIR